MIEKYPVPFRGLSYTLKLKVLESHYTMGKCENKDCMVCLFFKNVVNELPKLNEFVTTEMVSNADTIPDHLKYFNGNSEIKDEFERYLNRVIANESN